MYGFKTGDKVGGYDLVQVDRWTELPLKCNYYTILYWVGHNHLYDWEAVDIKWWDGRLWE
jgi:hypothetical protein